VTVAAPLILRPGDGARLGALTRASTAAAGHVQRARMVLLAAEGLSNAEIGRRVGMTRQTVISWRARYEAGGIDALADLPRSGRPAVIDEAAVVVATLNPPPPQLGVTHWSTRLMADHLRSAGMPVSFAEVARIWRDWDLQPHRVETFKFSTDPQLEAKIRDVVGLYLDPPANAVVVCVDEKSQIRALDRTAPLLPMPFDQAERVPTTTSVTAPPPCSLPWRSPPGGSPRMPATPGTATASSWPSSSR